MQDTAFAFNFLKEAIISKYLKIFLLSLLIVFISCKPTTKQMSNAEIKAIEKAIETEVDNLASAMNRLDVVGLVNLFSKIDGAKYISDGAYIPRDEIKKVLEAFYGSLQKMDFTFEKKEIRVLSPNAAVVTSWAHYTTVSKEGQTMNEKALYTSVYVQEDGKWSIFQAHKSFIE
jgi:uncharacterized protein (TIGR02246 family)